jgi:hypothetical protein
MQTQPTDRIVSVIRGFFAPAPGTAFKYRSLLPGSRSPATFQALTASASCPAGAVTFVARVGVTGFVTARYRSLGLARFLAEEIYRDRRSYKYCGDRRPAANRFAGKPEIV